LVVEVVDDPVLPCAEVADPEPCGCDVVPVLPCVDPELPLFDPPEPWLDPLLPLDCPAPDEPVLPLEPVAGRCG